MLTNAGALSFNILASWKSEASKRGDGRHIVVVVDISVLI